MKEETVAGLIVAGCLVAAFLVYSHASITVTNTPTPHAVATVAPPTPTQVPSPQPWDEATAAAFHTAGLLWIIAFGILPFAIYAGIMLVSHHRSKLPTEDWRIPFRDPQFPHVLDAHVRTSHPPVPQTYSPTLHIRNDQVPEVEQPAPQLTGPMPSAEALIALPGLAYGVRLDTGEPLIDQEIRSLLVGGQMGWGKSTFVALVAAQLHQVGARLTVGDPHASSPEGLTARMQSLIGPVEVEQEPRLIFQQVMAAWAELERREQLGDIRGLPPYVAIVDEFPELLRRLDDRDEVRLRDALLVIGGLSGRKFKVATIVMGQSWKNSVVGSTEMRDLVGAQAVFRMRKDEALIMTNLRSDYWNPDPLLLQKGEAFICGVVSGAVLVRVPPVDAPTYTRARGGPFAPLRRPFAGPFAQCSAEGAPARCRRGFRRGCRRGFRRGSGSA